MGGGLIIEAPIISWLARQRGGWGWEWLRRSKRQQVAGGRVRTAGAREGGAVGS
jgi:hypothetical protein